MKAHIWLPSAIFAAFVCSCSHKDAEPAAEPEAEPAEGTPNPPTDPPTNEV